MTAQQEGFQVATAYDGHEGAQKVAERAPDLIITDLMMPGKGGYEFLRDLQVTGHGAIPVLVISASLVNDSTVKLIRQEANVIEFIRKPLPMAALVARLHTVLKTQPPVRARTKGINDRHRGA